MIKQGNSGSLCSGSFHFVRNSKNSACIKQEMLGTKKASGSLNSYFSISKKEVFIKGCLMFIIRGGGGRRVGGGACPQKPATFRKSKMTNKII